MDIRIVMNKSIQDMAPYDMAFLSDSNGTECTVLICCPVCKWPHGLHTHHIAIQRGKITISPSIVCGNMLDGTKCPGHYWVRNNEVTFA